MARDDWRPARALLALVVSMSSPASASTTEPSTPGASAPRNTRTPLAAPRAGLAPADPAGRVSVWVYLDLPELASLAPDQVAQREVLRQQIQAQQNDVMSRLQALGAIEQARVQQARNALAVRLPAAQLEAARKLQGVSAISRVRDIDRSPLVHGD